MSNREGKFLKYKKGEMVLNIKKSFVAQSIMKLSIFKTLLLICFFLVLSISAKAQTVNVSTGSFIINMGVTPQTVGNALKPYGMIYDLIKNYKVHIYWSINPGKAKDGVDFTYNGVDYKGGTFIIPAMYRTPDVNARITFWQGQGVVGVTTTSPVTVPLFEEIFGGAPRWTMDQKNGKLALPYFANAGIPASAYGGSNSKDWKLPAALDCCDDLFVMPHADPIWATHSNLFFWNESCKGGLWAGCRAVSNIENMVNTANRSQQMNFLSVKDPAFTGTSGNYANSNSLIDAGSHSDGSPPYSYRLNDDPVAQFIGTTATAHQNGAEQIYIPRQGIVANPSTYSPAAIARWNPGAKVIGYDPTHPNVTNPDLVDFKNVAAVIVYGRGFDNPNRGYVMYEAGHSLSKATAPANIAAQRAFFNFALLVTSEKIVAPDLSSIPDTLPSNIANPIGYTLPLGANPADYTTLWETTCGGTFSPNATVNPVTYTPPVVLTPTSCFISVTITDACGRAFARTKPVVIIPCSLSVDRTVTPPSCFGGSDGSIAMNITGGSGPFTYSWTRVSPSGSGSGSGTTISGLSAGTYNVTVSNSSACSTSFTQLITQPNQLTLTPQINNFLCFGGTGSANVLVNGGTAPYTFSWTGPGGFSANTQQITGLQPGTYNVTVTDNNSCQASTSGTVTGPTNNFELVLDSAFNISCFGDNNGRIYISPVGGTPGYTYSWSDGATTQNRTNLSPNSYTVTATDAKGCIATLSRTITQPRRLTLSRITTPPTCPPGANPPANSDGTITLTVSGGTPPYTFAWSTVDGSGLVPNQKDQTGLTAGTYVAVVTDFNGCSATINTVLTNLFPLPTPPLDINKN